MPISDYSFLSDRQREYLENPESFDSQRAAEISYRIRKKYESARQGMSTLYEHAELWDKKGRSETVELKCAFHPSMGDAGPAGFGECDTIEVVDEYTWEAQVSGALVVDPPGGWFLPDEPASEFQFGVCPECRRKAKEHVRAHGTVPCTEGNHTAHRVADSEQFLKCLGETFRGSHGSNKLALSKTDLRELRESGVFDGVLPGDPIEPQ
jgi:hypothetical protein